MRSISTPQRNKYQAVEHLPVTPNYNRTAGELPAPLAPVCTSIGTAGGEDRFPQAQGSQGGEEEPEVSAWARDTETTSSER